MSILTTENLGLSFGAFDVFGGISVRIANDSKIGLIGPNGIGKTSLLLMLAGLSQPTTGSVTLARGKRLGYLRQEAVEALAARDNTVYAEMLTVFAPLQAQQARLHELEASMAAGDHAPETLDSYGALLAAFEHSGGYDYELRIQQTLAGLGLHRAHWDEPLRRLSGGQQTRALLARLLLEQPDLLMLDEPTNHLDAEAIEWLEHTLRGWHGAVLVVSHDRYFLDNVVNTIWEMERAGLEVYHGNYSAYLLQREARWEYTQRVFEEEKARLQDEMDYIQRNWVRATTHALALGRLRRVSREIAAIEAYGLMVLRSGRKWSELGLRVDRPLDVVDAIRRVNALRMPGRPPRLRPRLAPAHNSGNVILRARDLRVGYAERSLFTVSALELMRGECVALIGANGSGKTTFLKTLLGQLDPLGGQLHLGASLKIGYFAQAHESLQLDGTVLEELQRNRAMSDSQARSCLAQYLFRGEDVDKTVRSLSGGERARLALAILAASDPNFLLLDEPTNHLDIPAQEALQEVLGNFAGTILLVSHDRYLIDRLATQVWELRQGRLEVFRGSYREFVLQSAAPGAPSRQMVLRPKPLARDNGRVTRQRQQALAQVEARIREQEVTVQRLARELQHMADKKAFARTQDVSWEYARAQAQLEQLTAEWEKLAV